MAAEGESLQDIWPKIVQLQISRQSPLSFLGVMDYESKLPDQRDLLLHETDLGDPSFFDDFENILEQNHNLQSICLYHQSPEALAKTFRSLPRLRTVTRVSTVFTAYTQETTDALIAYLSSAHCTIRALAIYNIANPIAFAAILKAATVNKSLFTLRFGSSMCEFTQEISDAIVQLLTARPNLRHLDFRMCNIKNFPFEVALMTDLKLRTLRLDLNEEIEFPPLDICEKSARFPNDSVLKFFAKVREDRQPPHKRTQSVVLTSSVAATEADRAAADSHKRSQSSQVQRSLSSHSSMTLPSDSNSEPPLSPRKTMDDLAA